MINYRKIKAEEFATYWKDKGSEKSESQKFWLSLLTDVFGVEDIKTYIEFEDPVMLGNTGFIDGWIPATKVLIEQKSASKNLNEAIKQSDGSFLTPYQQAQRYNANRPLSKHARWIITCNFKEFYIYDMEHPGGEPEILKLADLTREYERLKILVDTKSEHIKREEEISKKAGDLIGILYDSLYKEYKDMSSEKSQKSLNMLCVRLVFCLYAEDAGLFAEKNQFIDYFKKVEPHNFRDTLINFFKVLNTKPEDRDKYINPELAKFPYVNGGLFADTDIEIPQFTEKIISVLIDYCGSDFDWSFISPTIFGAIFEATLNPDTRRSGGMHYTSIENIHKVIDPLFLDELTNEYNDISAIKETSTRNKKIDEYLDKMSKLTFLDPACGSGNFLTETYRSLRKLENKCLRLKINSEKGVIEGQTKLGAYYSKSPIKVNINQFYGIEINDFAVTVAKTALWIAESQMLKETEEILNHNIDFLPLKSYDNIVEGNALRLDWEKCFGADKKVDYIMGNPPFVGAMRMKGEKRDEIITIFPECKKPGEIDYVSGWYVKATKYIQESSTHCAFVSTNSICQGQQVNLIWEPLINKYNIRINFAYKTFNWESESNKRAAVDCIIIGFSLKTEKNKKFIFENNIKKEVKEINAYLMEGKDVFVEAVKSPISNVPNMHMGVMARDNGNLILSEEEYNNYVKNEPEGIKYIKRYIMGKEFIHNIKRYCFWLVNIKPDEIKKCKILLARIKKCKEYREHSPAKETQKFANTPSLFCQLAQPNNDYIAVPKVSSENRRYIPIGFMSKDVIAGDKIYVIENISIYNFSVLMSNVHNAWMRVVAGRLEMRYQYSNTIVYNNFPWPIDISNGDKNLTDKEKELIKKGFPTIDKAGKEILEKTGKAILDARDLYKDSSLADLYDPLTMPKELIKAHQDNDKAVCKAYGLTKEETTSESKCVEKLFTLYKMILS